MCGVCTENLRLMISLLYQLQDIYKGVGEPATQAAQRKPWQPQAPCMLPDPYSQFNNYP